jgi:dTDP-glucose 4,6-dehydratase
MKPIETVLVTGGAGFIGSNFVMSWCASGRGKIVNLDKLTYAGNIGNLDRLRADGSHVFVKGDINDRVLVEKLLQEHQPSAIIHFAAESHVDRSIHAPEDFIQTNVVGTGTLLRSALAYWERLREPERSTFRVLHISTDEVFGSLEPSEPRFSESSLYRPNSPYAASKAAADHMMRAFYKTYGLPVIITNCSNNYGPYQFPEKFIPLLINNARLAKPLPLYGDGRNSRDWLHVSDHCRALQMILAAGKAGDRYNIGGDCELTNLEVAEAICSIFDEICPTEAPHRRLVQFVTDRPGHDRRYAIDCSKLRGELGWTPAETFITGLRKTIEWYLAHGEWIESVSSGEYLAWMKMHYAQV